MLSSSLAAAHAMDGGVKGAVASRAQLAHSEQELGAPRRASQGRSSGTAGLRGTGLECLAAKGLALVGVAARVGVGAGCRRVRVVWRVETRIVVWRFAARPFRLTSSLAYDGRGSTLLYRQRHDVQGYP